MKNKKLSLWLLRLPVLLLALILAVSPLMMAAPARADVLTGSDLYIPGYSFVIESVFTDGAFDTARIYLQNAPFTDLSGYSFNTVLFDYPVWDGNQFLDPGYHVLFGAGASVEDNVIDYGFPNKLYKVTIREEIRDGYLYIFLDLGEDEGEHIFDVPYSGGYYYSYGTPVEGTRGMGFQYTTERPGGVLTVFSGVASFMSGVFQSATTMFWTAETGMSVLGYLAVASLALAVILLIFYLIAGWLKFH